MNRLEETHGALFEVRVLILRNGRIVADDTIEHLRSQMDQTSLDGVFTRVTEEAGTRDLSGRILQVMRS